MTIFSNIKKVAIAGLLGVSFISGVAVQGQTRRDIREDRQDRREDRRDRREDRRGRNWDRYGTYGGSFQLRQTALNAGYNEGIKEGRKDRNRRPVIFETIARIATPRRTTVQGSVTAHSTSATIARVMRTVMQMDTTVTKGCDRQW
jgi:hypothetical protein